MKNSFRKFLSLLFVAIGSVCALELNKLLLEKSVIYEVSLPLSAVSAVAISYLLDFLFLQLPLRFRCIRKVLLPESSFEGYWMQVVKNSSVRYYTLMEILFAKDNYCIKATTYLSDGQVHCNWYSTFVKINPDNHEMYYAYSATLLNSDNGESIKGYGEMRLEETMNKHKGGSGFFADQGSQPIKCAFKFEKIESLYFSKENKNKQFLEKRKQFIIKYNEYYSSSID